jgi:Sulfatase-modifying factor enzyme 1
VLLGRRPLPPGRDVGPDRVFVGGGPFTLGVDAAGEPFSLDNERPAHTVDVGPFWIGRVPVSNRPWREFIGNVGYQQQELWSACGWAHRTEADHSPRPGQNALSPATLITLASDTPAGGCPEHLFGRVAGAEEWHAEKAPNGGSRVLVVDRSVIERLGDRGFSSLKATVPGPVVA